MAILVVGSVAFDAIETPFGKTDKIVGGAATFISLTASYFHKPIHLVSVVGGDFPKEMINEMQRRGIQTDGLEVRENEKSFFWSGKYHNDMNARDTLVTELNVLANFNPIIPDQWRNAEYVMLGNLVPQVQENIIKQMKTRPRLVVMDTMNFWLDSAREHVLSTLKLVDVLTINDEEARQLAGTHSLRRAAKYILTLGPKFLVIKKGEHGALLFSGDEVFFAPALPLEDVFDPTGAGDTFAGGFLGYIAATGNISFENMKNAVIYGSTMASFCVEKFGPERMLELQNHEIARRLQQFLDLTQFKPQLGVLS